MELWLLIVLVVYGLIALAFFVWFMVGFFRRHPDGAVNIDELDFIAYITLTLIASVLWLLTITAVGVIWLVNTVRRHRRLPSHAD